MVRLLLDQSKIQENISYMVLKIQNTLTEMESGFNRHTFDVTNSMSFLA